MSLDQNLFTLHLTPNKDNPNIVDLVDPSGTIHYSKHRLPGAEYKIEVYGTFCSRLHPLSQSLLITAASPNATSKTKKLELYNPTILVELKYTGTLSFRWNFKFEDHEFEWKREECYMLRKPDPPVLIAITKEPAGRLKTATVQILDYNLNRHVFQLLSLEIVILTALLTFSDVNEGYHAPPETVRRNVERTPPAPNAPAVSRQTQPAEEVPPLPPPKPAPKTGIERIAEMQAALGEYNEIFVEEEGQVRHYAEYCSQLLEDDAMLFVTIRSAAAEQVPKVLQVVQETKRIRHKAGKQQSVVPLLHQYVVYDEAKKKGPRRINLDDVKPTTTATYTPPTSLTVHLSKIDMPELQPKAAIDERPSSLATRDLFKDTSSQESSPGRGSKAKTSKKDEKKASRPTTPPANSSKLIKHGRSSSPAARGYTQYSQPRQPSPSPPLANISSPYAGQLAEQAPSRPTYDFNGPDPNSSVPFPIPSVPSHGALNTGWEPHPPQSHYGPGAYAPPPHHPSAPGSTPSGPYPPSNSGYNPSYTSVPPSYVPPPPPPRPPISHGPSTPLSPHKSSIAASLLDSFWRR
ncbi:hypothetical protein C0993_010760 [Termitomyces sp. T159_Od127]|nr:hypothetical protein C0993_010760 [Termitomyces sp. T159_Od127]